MNRDPDTAWHALSPEEAARRLELDAAHGLIADEASRRLDAHGPNRLAERRPRPAWLKFFDQFRSVLIIILLGAAVLAGAIGNLKDAVVIAVVVLLPETWAAVRAARADRLQTSMNLAFGSALASIGLTIPVVVIAAVWLGLPLTLGLAPKDVALLAMTFIVGAITLGSGRTNLMQGAIHLVVFAAFLFLTFVP